MEDSVDMYKCPCCEYLTFDERPCGSFEICPVCFWEDDNVQNENIDFAGGANMVSLREAKDNFQLFGAIQKKYINETRPPLPNEIED